ncbi:tRNA (adenosine(37)-N6)-threonylcarbamoyltransferase complex ATPase subunit type 1 TsaE [Candidatus Soleaferrea massiliensis]|uniref:tRNA (adenosine(37)-N6)-threonylcarbamoyltransferase complex ATPase subunit type 1 TsaE n=1 Tax=Candidatus Soleaferrea massiliensis TaxID=1470354 RepID=UPI00058ECC78|nr:tRNA (adenosine(37)-N6)-threonylcarbamoyltransferase complex ATPase subunit type 1 TsaE [Candidatus Soleaferrea massiliensis]
MKTCQTHSYQETLEVAERLAALLRPGDVIAFKGGLGAGKTAFVTGLAKGLGIESDVQSPTFAIVNEYRGKAVTLYHFDMYRIETYEDLYSTGFFDYLETGAILAIEWSENIEGVLPENVIEITLSPGEDENSREITVKGDKRF